MLFIGIVAVQLFEPPGKAPQRQLAVVNSFALLLLRLWLLWLLSLMHLIALKLSLVRL